VVIVNINLRRRFFCALASKGMDGALGPNFNDGTFVFVPPSESIPHPSSAALSAQRLAPRASTSDLFAATGC
jgi:hypothetical protein